MASSSLAKLLFRDGKFAASLLFRTRKTNLTETVQSTGPAVRALLRLNQTPASQYPVFSEIFPVIQSGYCLGGFIQQETFEKMEAGQGKGVVDNERGDSEEEETDFDEEDIDDIDEDDEFNDSEEDDDDDDDDDDEEEEDKYTRKK